MWGGGRGGEGVVVVDRNGDASQIGHKAGITLLTYSAKFGDVCTLSGI